ncbi:cytochrome P450 family protein [Streptomyces syringium]|uniref:cytochrome P450 family protein n=1 Tax=Streptomyces syringium TaxID=76729 RepID=UPI0034515345
MSTPTLEDLTPAGTDFAKNPYPLYASLRERGPVHRVRTPDGRESWLIVGNDEARAALTDPRLRNDIRYSPDWEDDGGYAIGLNMLQVDPPHHTRLRKFVAKEFTPRRIEEMRPRIARWTGELLDAMLPLGRADLVDSFALPLPLTVICELLGVPVGDRAAFREWSNEVVLPSSPEAAGAAAQAMTAYFVSLIEAKRQSPGDDLLSALTTATDDDGDRLSPDELLGMAFVLLVAGHETTVNLISSGVHELLRHPDQLAALRADWSLLDGAIEEMLRYGCPVERCAFRYTAEPVEIGGTRIPAREPVIVVLAAAARDPRHFPEPDRFDIRREARGHLAFGHGVHHCIGAPLARMEAAIALKALLERCPDLAFDVDPAALSWRPSMALRGLLALPVRFTPQR